MPQETTWLTLAMLFLAAAIGGALNAVAGGGSFIAFPALLFAGVPPVNANATSTVALWPGTVASIGAYRNELGKRNWAFLFLLIVASLLGGILGAVLLLRTPQSTFSHLIPYLLLVATVLFTISRPITQRIRSRRLSDTRRSRLSVGAVAIAQFVIAGYGGYFGGGMGIMILATLGLVGLDNVHEMNAVKSLLAAAINGIAVVTFVVAGAIFWPQAAAMVVGATIGGYFCASFARRMDPLLVRRFVIVVGAALTIYFFLRG